MNEEIRRIRADEAAADKVYHTPTPDEQYEDENAFVLALQDLAPRYCNVCGQTIEQGKTCSHKVDVSQEASECDTY